MEDPVKKLCLLRNKLEMQLERNEEKGGESITLTKNECEDLFSIMKSVEAEYTSD